MSPAPDAAVVGAGIVGAACAWELARAGLKVEVIERGRPAGETTAAGMGHIVVMDDSPAQLVLTQWSRRLWDELASELPAAVEREVCGTLWIAADAAEMAAVESKRACLAGAGVGCEVLDGRQLAEAEPELAPGLAGALRVPGDGVIYPPAAARWLLDRAAELGARVVTGAAARRVGDGAIELAGGTEIAAGVVVDAAGLDAFDLLETPPPSLTLRPRKGHLVITDRYPGFCRHQLVELGYLKSAHGRASTSVAFNVQPRRTGQMLLGSSRQYDRTTSAVEPGLMARMIRRAEEFLPRIGRLDAIRAWTGFRAATSDGLPAIGAWPQGGRTLLAAGHEGLGITTALATARLIADHVLGREPAIDPAPYRPGRAAGTDHG